MPQRSEDNKVHRTARLKWVSIEQIKVSPVAQRELNQNRVDYLAAEFDPERLGFPIVNWRGGWFYVIDGQHRIEMLRQIGWGDQQVQCQAYEGMTEEEEAEMFLRVNDVLHVNAFDRFTKGITAGREVECDIDRVVRTQNLVVSRDKIPGAISAVGTLCRVYVRSDAKTLGRTLRIVRDAYGDPGLEAAVIDGIGLLCQRYNDDLDDAAAVKRLSDTHGGVNGLLGKAEALRRKTGHYRSHCVAAAAVDIINGGRGGKKLLSWWRGDA